MKHTNHTKNSETAVGVHGFSVFFSWQFHYDKTAATAVGRSFLNSTFVCSICPELVVRLVESCGLLAPSDDWGGRGGRLILQHQKRV